ncbi:MAG TPA: hypothetical protein VK255_02900 [Patescibacteria group bacterium]|nr:hypothetical protein [Patescibacteria group bacterium]
MKEKIQPTIENNKKESPEEYRQTCHQFKVENERYYTDNNFYRGNLISLESSEPKDKNAREILDDVRQYYEEKGDNFNLLRYYEKIGDKDNSYKMAEKIESSGNNIEKAHASQHIWKNFKDKSYAEKAVFDFSELARNYEEGGDNLMAGVYNDILFRLTKNEEFRAKAIEFHKKSAEDRRQKGDSWWEAISIREVGKLSKGTAEENEAVKVATEHANQEIERAQRAGDFKNAGLWARDIFMLTRTPEARERAKEIFLEQAEESERTFQETGKSTDLRTAAKSYWEMWKVTQEEVHRKKALEYFVDLLEIAKKQEDEKQIEECYRVLLYIMK